MFFCGQSPHTLPPFKLPGLVCTEHSDNFKFQMLFRSCTVPFRQTLNGQPRGLRLLLSTFTESMLTHCCRSPARSLARSMHAHLPLPLSLSRLVVRLALGHSSTAHTSGFREGNSLFLLQYCMYNLRKCFERYIDLILLLLNSMQIKS